MIRPYSINLGNIVIFGILHNDQLKNITCNEKFSWQHVNWNMIVRLELSQLIPKVLGESSGYSSRHDIEQNVLLLCYDGWHTPPIPDPACFTQYIPDLIFGKHYFSDTEEKMMDIYCRIMRCAISAMKHHPDHVNYIALALNLHCSGSSTDDNDSNDHLLIAVEKHQELSQTEQNEQDLIGRLSMAGALLFKEAKLLYLRSEMKKWEDMF